MSKRKAVTSSVPPGSILGQILFTINDTDSGIECTISKLRDDTKLSGAADLLQEKDVSQRDLDKLAERACANLIKLTRAKCKVLYLSHGNPQYHYRQEMNGLRAALQRRAWGYWWKENCT